MKTLIWKVMLAATLFSMFLIGSARAQDGDYDGCSNATLHGDYAFTLHGESLGILTTGAPLLFPSPLPADGVAMTYFDGNGGLSQVDFVMRAGTPAPGADTPTADGFRSGETGTYTVEADCTGKFTITFPDTTEIDVKFVLANYGREIRTVVTRQHVPGLPLPAGANCVNGCDLAVQIRSDGKKVQGFFEQ
jgi:hypothetical protein